MDGEANWRHRYLSYLVWAVGLSLVALAFTDVDRYLLAQVISLELLALFHIGSRVGRLANRLLGVANIAFQPEVTRLDTEGREETVVRSTRIFLKFNSAIAVFVTAFIVIFAREIIVLVSSDGYTGAVPLLVILAVSFPLTTMTAPITSVMKALDQIREALLCDLAWAVAYVVLIVALAPPLGLVGVGLAHLCACVAQLLLAVRISKLPLASRYVFGLGARLFAAGLVSFVPVLLIDAVIETSSIWFSGLEVLLFVSGALVFRRMLRALNVFDPNERSTLADLLEARRLGIIGRLIGV
jgi:O-antigen/teichoic acid export membrane protein